MKSIEMYISGEGTYDFLSKHLGLRSPTQLKNNQALEYAVWLTEQSENKYLNEVSPVIQQAIGNIKEHHQKSISLNEIAQYCCLSRHHFV
ncbi:hypothetical protein [Neobacillus sp. SuZ13]|uniref:hypothetical protein n=1 Tax=Neobacillus sp. SuZ13 TaxID=3047875 RepID=UPI0024C0D580|nr:hypothetical protein [Neobacillus sp. SuZ13]WHY66501.1 hypothetical protein QNH17_26185 [Neobacillus sp. SuZ13]